MKNDKDDKGWGMKSSGNRYCKGRNFGGGTVCKRIVSKEAKCRKLTVGEADFRE